VLQPLVPIIYPFAIILFLRGTLVYYIISDPPYVLLIAGLFASLASGVAFDAVLKQSVREWSKNRSAKTLVALQGMPLLLPFLGICAGVCVFLASGLQIFIFSAKIGYGIALPMTILIGWLVWTQLGKILIQLEQGGSRALDLDV
jgi:uncharacterized membrane protein